MKDLNSFVKNFTNEKIEYEKKGKKYFLVSDEIKKIEEKIPGAISSGILLGEEGENFRPSVYLLELLTPMTKNKIFVNDKAEWLFLCRRDVLPEGIVRDESTQEIFLVQNTRDENLGLGKKVKRNNQSFVKHILDRGDFLRRERK